MTTVSDAELHASHERLLLQNRIAAIFLVTAGDAIFAKILDVVRDVLESPFGFFGYVNDDGDLVCPSMTRDIWERCQVPDKSIVFPRAVWGGLWGRSLRERKTLLTNTRLSTPDGHVPLHAALVSPIVHADALVGQLAVANKPGGYTDRDRTLIDDITAHIAPILHSRLDARRHERERSRTEEQLRNSLAEKEVLLREIHHRVKNNLQVVSSLLYLAADELDHPAARRRLHDSRRRVMSMALVHEQLYQSRDLARIDFAEYLQRIAGSLQDTQVAPSAEIVVEAERIPLDISAAIPCGLIVNELVANACAHAFAAPATAAPPEVRIGFRRGRDTCRLTVADNGAGFPDTLDFRQTTSMGLRLVNTLVRQLRGTIAMTTDAGTTFTIAFPAPSANANRADDDADDDAGNDAPHQPPSEPTP